VVLYAIYLVFTIASGDVTPEVVREAGWPLISLIMATLGSLIAHRRADNRMGVLLVVAALPMLGYAAARAHALYGLARSDTSGIVEVTSWLGFWLWMPAMTLLALVVFLFPTGRPPTPRWSRLVYLMVGQITATVVTAPLLLPSWTADRLLTATQPSDVPGGGPLDLVGNLGFIPIFLAACVGFVARYRRAQDVERLQMKWLGLSASMVLIVSMAPLAFPVDNPMEVPLYAVGVQVGILGIPVAMALAILRYRLYDIDRIISRTLSYGIVTAVLLGVYVGGVIGVGALVPGERSDLLVAGSTLVVAALFRPLRDRVQSLVDRRFNRAHYDAHQLAHGFGVRLRDEVALVEVTDALRRAVSTALQPATLSVWLRDAVDADNP
jgi:hypothetical protein